MGAWANIVVSPDDPEIASIDALEGVLGELPESVLGVRELITRFESCHFKARRHYRHILDSIEALRPAVDPADIGAAHPRNGPDVVGGDPTGRARLGQRFIEALRCWLRGAGARETGSTGEMNPPVEAWLGARDEDKERLVRLLLARLHYEPLEEHQRGGEWAALEYQVIATDICCYAFPDSIEQVIRAIGRLEPLTEFHGCGTSNPEIDAFLSTEIERLRDRLLHADPASDGDMVGRGQARRWLVACLVKTLKEQGHLAVQLPCHPSH